MLVHLRLYLCIYIYIYTINVGSCYIANCNEDNDVLLCVIIIFEILAYNIYIYICIIMSSLDIEQ